MKKIFYTAMLFLGLSIVTTSCEKIGSGDYSGTTGNKDLLGKWEEYTYEYVLNGKTVAAYDGYHWFSTCTFYDNGVCLIESPYDEGVTSYLYDNATKVLYININKFIVESISSKEMIWSGEYEELDPHEGDFYVTYNGVNIYKLNYDTFYYTKNGKYIRVYEVKDYSYGKTYYYEKMISMLRKK